MFLQFFLLSLSFAADKDKARQQLASWVQMNPTLDLWKADTISRFAKALNVSQKELKEMLDDLKNTEIPLDERTISKLSEDEDENRAIGVMLWAMMGDILGAPLEALAARKEIGVSPWVQAIKKILPEGPLSFYPTDVYRVNNIHRLIKRECGVMDYVEVQKPRIVVGWYTDDTAASIGLARTLVEQAEQASLTVASFIPDAQDRGTEHPSTAFGSAVAKAYVEMAEVTEYRGIPDPPVLKEGVAKDYTTSGKWSHPTGSFANGGAMRIGPLGVVSRNLSPEELRTVVKEAIRPTHINPIAIDGAVIIARLVGMYMNDEKPDVFDEAIKIAQSPEAKKTMEIMQNIVRDHPESEHLKLLGEKTIEGLKTQSFLDFQMRADIAVAVVLYTVEVWGNNPEQCLINVAALGGDSDTLASMAGAIMGARHGTEGMPARWFENAENGEIYHNGKETIENEWGRDKIISLAQKLSKVQIKH